MHTSIVLVVGGTGYIGSRIVRASLAQGHPTYVLQRKEIGVDIEKVQMLLSFKEQGACLVEASFDDHQSLVNAVKQADVVICAMSGIHLRSHSILMQLKLVEAIKEAGNIKCFLPSEFGMDPSRMGHALEPGKLTFDQKMEVRKAMEVAEIPFTYVSTNCFAGSTVDNLCQLGSLFPPKDKVLIYGDGNVKVYILDEKDIATYTIKTIDDPWTLNKTLYLRPKKNMVTQMELVEKWEKFTGNTLNKVHVTSKDFLGRLKGN